MMTIIDGIINKCDDIKNIANEIAHVIFNFKLDMDISKDIDTYAKINRKVIYFYDEISDIFKYLKTVQSELQKFKKE